VAASPYDFPSVGEELDYRPLLRAVIADRLAGRPVAQIARGFHGAVAQAIVASAAGFAARPLVVSGGVFQNSLLVELLHQACGDRLWMNRSVPPNDGGISLGQAALASVAAAGASPSVTARAAQGVAR
jgi:hydrogenase maturation protein HypF